MTINNPGKFELVKQLKQHRNTDTAQL
uniref:Uncharacterized protein n=1 Tax=Arundo donax TaxID=35708 RepID=A0A0A9AY67_ARUDO